MTKVHAAALRLCVEDLQLLTYRGGLAGSVLLLLSRSAKLLAWSLPLISFQVVLARLTTKAKGMRRLPFSSTP